MVSKNDAQRLFLQSVFSRRSLSAKLAKTLYEKSVRAVETCDDSIHIQYANDSASWNEAVAKINQALNPLDLEFKRYHEEDTGDEMYVIVNGKGDDVAQAATDYSPIEIAYFKLIVELIMLAPNESYSVSSLAALREVSALKSNMTKTQAENVLASFVARGWLKKSRRGRYSLTSRTLVELNAYLKTNYGDDLLECIICLETLTRGVACPTAACAARLHNHCFQKYARAAAANAAKANPNNPTGRNASAKCPSCSTDWGNTLGGAKGNTVSVGEVAARDGQVEGRRRKRPANDDAGADEEEEADETMYADDSQPSQAPATKKGKGKAKARRAIQSDDEDEDELEEDEMDVDER